MVRFLRVRTPVLLTLGLALSLGAASAAGSPVSSDENLAWYSDPSALLDSRAGGSLVVPIGRAMRILESLNSDPGLGQGHHDWRLPTSREVAGVLGIEAVRSASRLPALPVGSVFFWPVRGSSILPGFSSVVVLGINSVHFHEGVRVASGDVVANDSSSGPTLLAGWEMALDPHCSVAADSVVQGDSLRLKAGTVVGDVRYNEISSQGIILGTSSTPLTLPVFAQLPAFFAQAPAAGSPAVTIPAGGSASLPPGDYASLTVHADATLTLLGGDYNVGAVVADRRARLLFLDAANLRVAGRLATGKEVKVGPAAGATIAAQDIVFYVAGINGADGALGSTPPAAEIGPGSAVAANFYVPNGTLRLRQRTQALGAFLARDLEVDNDAVLVLDSAFFNRPPIAVDDRATVDEGGTVAQLDGGAASVLANDSDPNLDPLTVTTTPVSGPSHGTVALAADGTFSYTHDGSETTADAFIYEVCDDGTPPLCATASVAITVVPVNDPPLAVADSITVTVGATATQLDSGQTSLLANDSDPENGQLSLTSTPVTAPSHGALSLFADGTFVYTHNGDDSIADAFVYEVCDDGSPALCATATVSIAVARDVDVTVTLFGLGSGTVTSAPAGIDCGTGTCTAAFGPVGQIVLTAAPAPGSTFGGFSGDADCADGTLTTDADKTCLARFDLQGLTATLSLTIAGGGSGRVTGSPSGIDCPAQCSATYPIPTRVELSAFAEAGSIFAGWSGDADCEDGFVDVFADTACSARFELLPAPPAVFHLTLLFQGTGSGTVTSNPPGVLCEEDCTVAFPQGTSLNLLERPLQGSFVAWGGDCGGTSFVTSVTLDADKVCTVRFDL